jgi:uncharacterized membrane protein YccF (DUF307 family)
MDPAGSPIVSSASEETTKVNDSGQIVPSPLPAAPPSVVESPPSVPVQALQAPIIQQTIIVQQTQTAPVIIAPGGGGPNILIRLIYFVFIGWWLGAIVSLVGWLLFLTIIGIPLGLMIVNRLPSIITLRSQEQNWRIKDGVLTRGKDQRPFLMRAAWFLFVGWWLCGVLMAVAYGALLTILLIPVSFWMYGRVGAVTTLYRS